MSSLRVLPRGDREAVPHGREDRGSSHFLQSALSGGGKENPPFRRMAGDLDPDPLPLRPAGALATISPGCATTAIRSEFLASAGGIAAVRVKPHGSLHRVPHFSRTVREVGFAAIQGEAVTAKIHNAV